MTKRSRAIASCGLLALVLLAAGCKPFSGPLPGDPAPAPYFFQHLSGEGTFPLDIDLGDETRDVYLTFVNPDLGTSSGIITVSGSSSSVAPGAAKLIGQDAAVGASVTKRAPTPAAIMEFNQDPFGARGRPAPSLRLFERTPGPLLRDEIDDTFTFYDYDYPDKAPDYFYPVPSTCQAVIGPIDVGGGNFRTLNIWVANNCWDDDNPLFDGDRTYLVDQGMVDAIGLQFLQAGASNDIYDWVTAMLGPEWGAHQYTDLIDPNDEITIWLCDIEDDDSFDGGVVGYFWSKDNHVNVPGQQYIEYSHERVMFTIDAVMYANPAGGAVGWNATDYWPEEIYSTLAHEFQHMIHFYQRAVLRDAIVDGDTWINEMASQVVEDLLADKMDVIGPRGVTGADGTAGVQNNTEGRLPLFNYLNDISLTYWPQGGGGLENYSITYAFGAWLARNYGGAMLLNRLMQSNSTGRASIEDIVSQATGKAEYFPRLMQRWSAAQLLSDATDAPPGYRYNAGTFFDSAVGSATYRLGSINLFNYKYGTLIGPWIYSGAAAGTSPYLSTSATLYRAATAATGPLAFTLEMPEGLIASVIVR